MSGRARGPRPYTAGLLRYVPSRRMMLLALYITSIVRTNAFGGWLAFWGWTASPGRWHLPGNHSLINPAPPGSPPPVIPRTLYAVRRPLAATRRMARSEAQGTGHRLNESNVPASLSGADLDTLALPLGKPQSFAGQLSAMTWSSRWRPHSFAADTPTGGTPGG